MKINLYTCNDTGRYLASKKVRTHLGKSRYKFFYTDDVKEAVQNYAYPQQKILHRLTRVTIEI